MNIKKYIIAILSISLISVSASAQNLGDKITLEAKTNNNFSSNEQTAKHSLHSDQTLWNKKLRTRKISSTNFLVEGQLSLTRNDGCSADQASAFNTQFNVNVNSQRKVNIKFATGLTASGKAAANGKSFTAKTNMSVYNQQTGHDEDRSINIYAGAISSKGYAPFKFIFGARDTVNNATCSVQYNGTLKVRKR